MMIDDPDKKEAPPAGENIVYTSDCIQEALAKQAAMRPPKSPPKAMPVTPTLPRQPKPARARKRAAGRGW